MAGWFPTTTITDVLNQWAELGVFSYVIPFMLIFAIVFAIIQKTQALGNNRGVAAIIAAAVGLLALQFDFVSTFFATIFPRMGVAIGILVVMIVLLGVFYQGDISNMKWVGYILAIGVVVWALVSWDFFGDNIGISFWISENFWSLAILALVIISLYMIAKSPEGSSAKSSKPAGG